MLVLLNKGGLPGGPGREERNLTGVLVATMRDLSRSGPQRLAIGRTGTPRWSRLYDGQPAPVSRSQAMPAAATPARQQTPATPPPAPAPDFRAPRNAPPGTDGYRG